MAPQSGARIVPLPAPTLAGDVALEAAFAQRRSVREYTHDPLTLAEVAQLLWAGQGATHSRARRTVPSAGALYPIELYLLAGDVTGLETGLYRYRVAGHDLVESGRQDLRADLADAALGQDQVKAAPAVIVIAGAVGRTASKYGQRATRYVLMEVGSVAQNIHLQAAALGLGTVFIGAMRDARVMQVLGMPDDESPFCIMPIGKPR
jgi:SagB-type dehydrogenase family enzyme